MVSRDWLPCTRIYIASGSIFTAFQYISTDRNSLTRMTNQVISTCLLFYVGKRCSYKLLLDQNNVLVPSVHTHSHPSFLYSPSSSVTYRSYSLWLLFQRIPPTLHQHYHSIYPLFWASFSSLHITFFSPVSSALPSPAPHLAFFLLTTHHYSSVFPPPVLSSIILDFQIFFLLTYRFSTHSSCLLSPYAFCSYIYRLFLYIQELYYFFFFGVCNPIQAFFSLLIHHLFFS